MNAGVMSRAKYTLEFKQEAVKQVKAGRPLQWWQRPWGCPAQA